MGAADKEPTGGEARSAKAPQKTSDEKPIQHPNQLGQLRRLADKTQREIAEYLGVSNKTVSAWECGTREMKADSIVKLCDFLGCTPDELLGYDEESRLPELDIYEERIYTLVHGMNEEGKAIVYNVTEGISLDPKYGGRKKKRSRKRNRPKR